ncbi:mucin-19-like [Macrobrachium nipponense]|uniref:mucin-19-like n=1 Tax=Macrobrachium nipponense TaxID=159736 RepID=UPI0030C82BDF
MDTMLNALAFLLVLLLIIEKTESQEYGNAVPTQGYLAPTRETNKEDEYYEDDASYSFRYNVEDPFAGNYYGHYEERDGDHTAGGYNVLLPDGRHQKVSYTVSGDSGFVAQVEYEGVAKFYSQPVRHNAIASHGAFAHSQSFSTSPGDHIHTELLPTPQALTFSTGNVGAQQTHKAGVFAGTAGFDAGSVSNLNALGFQNSEITSSQHIVAEGSSEVGRDDGIVNAGASSAPSEGIHTESQTGSGIGTFALDAGSSHATGGGTEFPGDIVASSFSGGHFGSTGSPLAAGDITDGLSLGQTGSHDSSLSFGSPGSIPVGGNTFVGHTESSIIPAGVQLNVDHSGSGGNLGLISQSPGVTVIPVRETGPVNSAFVTSHEANSGTGFDVRSFEGFVPVLSENGGQGFLFSQALNEGSGFEVQQPGISNQLTNVVGLSDIDIHAGGLSSIALTSGNTGFVEGTSNQFTVGGANILGTRHSDFNIVPIYSVGTDLGVTNELSTVAEGGNTGSVEGISNQLTVGGANILGTRHSDFNIVPIQSVNTDLGVTNELSNVAEGGNTRFVERTSNQFTVGGANILGTRHSGFNIVPIHSVGTDLGVTNELSNVAELGSRGFEIGQVGGITNLLSNGGASFGVRPSSGITVAEGTGSGPVGGVTGASLGSSSVGFGVSPSDGLPVGKGIRSNGFGSNLVDDEGGSRSSDIRIGQVRGVTFAPLISGGGVSSEIGASQETESTLGIRESRGRVDSVGFSSNHIDEISSNQGKNLGVGHSVSNAGGKSNSLPSIDVNAFTVAPEPVKTTDNIHTVQEDSPNQLADIDTSRTALHTGTAATGHFNQVSNSGFQQPSQLEVIDTSRTALHTGAAATGHFNQPVRGYRYKLGNKHFHTWRARQQTGHFNQVSNSGFQQPSQLEVIDTSRTALHTGGAATGHFNHVSNSGFQQPSQLEVIDTSRTALHTGGAATGHFNQVSTSGFQQPSQLADIDTSRTALHTGTAATGHFNQASNSGFQQPSQLADIDTSRTALHTGKASTGHFNQVSNSDFQQPNQLEVIDTSKAVLHTRKAAIGRIHQVSNADLQHLHLQPQTELGVTVINFGSDLSHENLRPLSSLSSLNNNHIPQGAKAVKAPTIIAATLLGDDISGPHEAILRKLVDGALKGDVGSHPDIRVVRVA